MTIDDQIKEIHNLVIELGIDTLPAIKICFADKQGYINTKLMVSLEFVDINGNTIAWITRFGNITESLSDIKETLLGFKNLKYNKI